MPSAIQIELYPVNTPISIHFVNPPNVQIILINAPCAAPICIIEISPSPDVSSRSSFKIGDSL